MNEEYIKKLLERILEAYNEGCPIPKSIIRDIEIILEESKK